MLDVARQLDHGFAIASSAPRFAPVAILEATPAGSSGASLIAGLNRDFENHKRRHSEWMARGIAERVTLDQALRNNPEPIDDLALLRMQILIDGIAERARTAAEDYARFVKSMRQISQKIARYSKPTSQSLNRWIDQTERHLEGEIDFLTESADHYAAMRAAYGADFQSSGPLDTAEHVLDFLKRSS